MTWRNRTPSVTALSAGGVAALHINAGISSNPVGWLVDAAGHSSIIHGDVGAHRVSDSREWLIGGPFRAPLPDDVRTVRLLVGREEMLAQASSTGWLAVLPPDSDMLGDLRVQWTDNYGRAHLVLDVGLRDLIDDEQPTSYP